VEARDDVGRLKIILASDATSSREWSSITFKISTPVPPKSFQWVMSACHRSLGISASNRTSELLGRLCDWGVTKPRRVRILQIVATEGTACSPWRRTRWTLIVCAPASNP
jgi:hypothetical protein